MAAMAQSRVFTARFITTCKALNYRLNQKVGQNEVRDYESNHTTASPAPEMLSFRFDISYSRALREYSESLPIDGDKGNPITAG